MVAEERSGRQGMLGRVLVTGATGFVGQPLVAHLAARGWAVTAGVRSLPPPARRVAGVAYAAVGEVGPVTEWGEALRGVTHVVHTAARVHAAGRRDEAEFDRVNARGTALLAEQAAECGVQRFVFLSSIKVNGEATSGQPFRAEDAPKPADAYARSKLAAEQALWRVCGARPMEGVVIRLPLVYGPGAKANVARLERLVESGLPLPFRSIDNRRSLLALGNLCDFVALALEHPQAAGRVWLLSDGADLSTAEIVQHIASARHRPARLVRCPAAFLRVLGRLTGRSAEVARLTGSLQLDSGPAHRELGWRPPFSMGAALAMATAYEAGATAGASTAMGDG